MGQIQCTEQALLHAELSSLCHCGVGEQGKVSWSLSVGSPVEKVSAGGPQPALPLFCHFPVYLLLVFVSPLLPPEEAELVGRTVKHREELDQRNSLPLTI